MENNETNEIKKDRAPGNVKPETEAREKTSGKSPVFIWCVIVGIICFVSGALLCVIVLFAITDKTKAKPAALEDTSYGIDIPDSEITDLAYDSFWSYIPHAYMAVGELGPGGLLYKISENVPRSDKDPDKFYVGDDGYMHYEDEDTLFGVDISYCQTDIDWDVLAANKKVDFVILRLGYRGYESGRLMVDSNFEDYIVQLNEHKIKTGIYFFTQAVNYDEGVEEANFVLENLKGHRVTYPIIIDTEWIDDDPVRGNEASVDDRTDGIVGFCETIKAAGYTPMIYANRNWFAQDLNMDKLGDYQLWLAQYSDKPNFPYKYRGWQYASDGYVDGINGEVDVNIWFKEEKK